MPACFVLIQYVLLLLSGDTSSTSLGITFTVVRRLDDFLVLKARSQFMRVQNCDLYSRTHALRLFLIGHPCVAVHIM